eukprot:5610-Eustigmatos_ZCMA.PRE.1
MADGEAVEVYGAGGDDHAAAGADGAEESRSRDGEAPTGERLAQGEDCEAGGVPEAQAHER